MHPIVAEYSTAEIFAYILIALVVFQGRHCVTVSAPRMTGESRGKPGRPRRSGSE